MIDKFNQIDVKQIQIIYHLNVNFSQVINILSEFFCLQYE